MNSIEHDYVSSRKFVSTHLLDFCKKEGLGYEYDSVFDNIDCLCYDRIDLKALETMETACLQLYHIIMRESFNPSQTLIYPKEEFMIAHRTRDALVNMKKAIELLAQKKDCKLCNLVERIKELKALVPECRKISMAQYILYSYWGLVPDNCRVDFEDIHRFTIEKMEVDPVCSPHLSSMFLNFLTNLKPGDYLSNLERLTNNSDIFNKILEIVDPDQFMDIMGINTRVDRASFRRNWNAEYFVNRKFR